MKNEIQISVNTYQSLLSMHNLALLSDWLAANGELAVDVDLPHSGGSSTMYFIKSLTELHEILFKQTWPEIHLVIFREKQYSLRGIVDDSLITRAVESIVDGSHYVIMKLAEYPSSCSYLDEGKSHKELREQLSNLNGEIIAIGVDPFEAVDLRQKDSYKNAFSLSVSKNQNYYEPYAKTPERYTRIVEEWAKSE